MGMRVATVISGRFVDEVISPGQGERICIGGSDFEPGPKFPPMTYLPDEWEFSRQDRPVPKEATSVLAKLKLGMPPAWGYQRMCEKPVVVISQRPAQVVDDLEQLSDATEWWNPIQAIGILEPKSGVDWWLRRPIVVTSPAALIGSSWASGLPASLIVISGFAAWSAPVRRWWPGVPQILVLNQRSSDVSDFREWFDGTEFPEVQLPAMRNLRRAGITVNAFGEPIGESLSGAQEAEEADEWDF
jgi:hypothetical protein